MSNFLENTESMDGILEEIKRDDVASSSAADTGNVCSLCGTQYKSVVNLRRHARQKHPDEVQIIAPMYLKNKNNFAFSCGICGRNFNNKKHMRYHLKKSHEITQKNPVKKTHQSSTKCPLCLFHGSNKPEVLKHFELNHEILLTTKKLEFSSLENFQQWLKSEEKRTKSKYTKKDTKKYAVHNATIYECHRSGIYVPEGKGLRKLKSKGSVKINGYCPSKIQLTENKNGTCEINYTETHVGHSADLGHLYLTKEEKSQIASQIERKIPFDEILDNIRETVPSLDPQRIHLLNRKDLFNIEKSFKLNGVKNANNNKNDHIKIENWIDEMRRESDCVLFYKPREAAVNKGFILIIMTPAQSELLKKYGGDCVYIDTARGVNNYDFKLHTLLVLDNLRECLPCAFCISSRSNEEVLQIFFQQIRLRVGTITPDVFMSDIADCYYNAWSDVMGVPGKRLLCAWYIDQAWRNNLSKIQSKEKQLVIYKQLRTLLEEPEFNKLQKLIYVFTEETSKDPDTQDFSKYFLENYSTNYDCWACNARLHAGLKANMRMERFHKTIKYVYLRGKNVKRLDKSISDIMRLARDKMINTLTAIDKNLVRSKTEDLRIRHCKSLALDAILINPVEGGWEISSGTKRDTYFIEEINQTCACRMICDVCNVCIHRFHCSCTHSAINFNMCEHIHLLATWRNFNNGVLQIRPNVAIEREKEEIMNLFKRHLDSVHTPEQLDVVKKFMGSISPQLTALSTVKSESFPFLN